jgi:hypothetical protein
MNISSLQEFYRGFYVTRPEGNNAFSYDQRSHKKIYVPPLIKGSLEDVQAGEEIVFCDIVDDMRVGAALGRPSEGDPRSPLRMEVQARGLKHFVHIERPGQDIFIFDNHNHVFAFWAAGVHQGVIPKNATLVHVDQHKDTREPKEWFAGQGTPEACHYANRILNVGNFIPPALKAGWFKDVVQVGSAGAFGVRGHIPNSKDEFGTCPRIPFVLDIDLDIFAPIMAHIPDDVKIARLCAWMAAASFITVATSPFFMDQNQALHYLRRLI